MPWLCSLHAGQAHRPYMMQSTSLSATYNADPYLYVDNPLDKDDMEELDRMDMIVNSNTSKSLSYSETNSASGMVQVSRKLNTKGRNITVRADASYSDGESTSASLQNVRLYQILDMLGNDSTYNTNRYNLAPTKVYRGKRDQLYIPLDGVKAFEMRWAYAPRNNFVSIEHESEDKPITVQP